MARKIIWERTQPPAKTTLCRFCGTTFTSVGGVKHNDHKRCSPLCFIRVGPKETIKSNKKAKNYKISIKTKFYDSQEWLELRYTVLRRYGRVCMCCGETKGKMHVDHIKPRSRFPELALEFTNLQVLCGECNMGKSNKFEDDFRSAELSIVKKVS